MGLDYEIIGKRIKLARHELRFTQEEVADALQVSVAFYSRIETGRSAANLKRIVQIANILKVEPGYLIGGSSKSSNSYLTQEFNDILEKCTPKQEKFIYKVAELVVQNQL